MNEIWNANDNIELGLMIIKEKGKKIDKNGHKMTWNGIQMTKKFRFTHQKCIQIR